MILSSPTDGLDQAPPVTTTYDATQHAPSRHAGRRRKLPDQHQGRAPNQDQDQHPDKVMDAEAEPQPQPDASTSDD